MREMILIAPLQKEGYKSGDQSERFEEFYGEGIPKIVDHRVPLEDSHSYQTIELSQSMTPLNSSINFEGVDCIYAGLSEAQGIRIIYMHVRILDSKLYSSREKLEQISLELIENIISINDIQNVTYRWINRTLIEDDNNNIPELWVYENGYKSNINIIYCNGDKVPAEINISWANNTIVLNKNNSKEMSPDVILDAYREYHKGMMDAQRIWLHHEYLLERAQRITRDLATSKFNKKIYEKVRLEILHLSVAYSIISLSQDELNTKIQGIRSSVGRKCLEAWKFKDLRERLKDQINLLEVINNQNNEIDRSKYQKTVDTALMLLGFLTLAQTILGVVDLTYAGGVENIPGDGSMGMGISASIRSVSVDTWFIVAFLITLCAILITRIRGRK